MPIVGLTDSIGRIPCVRTDTRSVTSSFCCCSATPATADVIYHVKTPSNVSEDGMGHTCEEDIKRMKADVYYVLTNFG